MRYTSTWLVSYHATKKRKERTLAALRPSQDLPRVVFRIFMCVSCSLAALSLSISSCKTKRKNHWQQRLCRGDICECQARAFFLIHLRASRGTEPHVALTLQCILLGCACLI